MYISLFPVSPFKLLLPIVFVCLFLIVYPKPARAAPPLSALFYTNINNGNYNNDNNSNTPNKNKTKDNNNEQQQQRTTTATNNKQQQPQTTTATQNLSDQQLRLAPP